MAKRQDFSIAGIQLLQGNLNSMLVLRFHRLMGRRGQLPNQFQRERGGIDGSPMRLTEVHITKCCSCFRPEVAAVSGNQVFDCDPSQPDVHRNRRLRQIGPGSLGRFQVRILNHVGFINAPQQSLIESQTHHPLEPVAILSERLTEKGLVFLGQIVLQGCGHELASWPCHVS